MDLEDILDKNESFGKYQKFILLLVSLTVLPWALHHESTAYIRAFSSYTCAVSDSNFSDSLISNGNISHERDQCYTYFLAPSENETILEREDCPYGWTFETYHVTIVTEWNLICHKEWILTLSKYLDLLSYVVGCLIFCVIADLFGRRITLSVCIAINIVFGILLSVSPNIIAFELMKFISGAACIGMYTVACVLAIEFSSYSQRIKVLTALGIVWCLCHAFLSTLALKLTQWRALQLTISVPLTILIFIPTLIPESPRWCHAKGKVRQARDIVKRLTSLDGSSTQSKMITSGDESSKYPWNLFSRRKLRRRFLYMASVFFFAGMTFHGNLPSNKPWVYDFRYIMSVILDVLQLILLIAFMFIANRFGRKASICICFMISSISQFIFVLFPHVYIFSPTLKALHFSTCVSGICILYLISAEISPSILRTCGIGFCSIMFRCGGLLIFTIINTVPLSWMLYQICLAFSAFMVSILIILLPETRKQSLPSKLDDAEDIQDDYDDIDDVFHIKYIKIFGRTFNMGE